jgi:hypothetical protein
METKGNGNREGGHLFFAYGIKVNDRLDFAAKAVELFNAKMKLLGNEHVSVMQKRHVLLLAYYLVYGTSKKMREDYAYAMNYSVKSVDVMSSCLSKAGYVMRDKQNMNKLVLCPEMESLSKFILKDTDKQKCFVFIMGDNGQ